MAKRILNIRIKRIYDPPEVDDGARILVDRLWPRGVSKEKARLTLWLKEIAPSPELRHWFAHDPARWEEFERRYCAELAGNDTAVAQVTEHLKHGGVTLLYAAHDPQHNHAVILEAFLRNLGKATRGGAPTSPLRITSAAPPWS